MRHLPAEVHQLVVAQPGQRGPDPHVDEQEDEGLAQEPQDRDDPVPRRGMCGARPVRAAEEQRHDDRRHRDRVHELGQVEEREADRRVLGVEAADELLSASTRSNGGRLSSAVMAIRKRKNGTNAEPDEVPVPEVARPGQVTIARVDSDPVIEDHRHDRRGRARPRRRSSGPTPGPSRAAGTSSPTTSRPASPRRPRSTTWPAANRMPIGGSATCSSKVWSGDGDDPADGDDGEDEERRQERQVRRQLEHEAVGALRDRGPP